MISRNLLSARLAPARKEGSYHRPDSMAARLVLPHSKAVVKALVWLLIVAILAFGSGCAKRDWIDRTLVTVDAAGTWYGTIGGASAAMGTTLEMWLELEQAGSKVNGSVRYKPDQSFNMSGPIGGTVSGDVFRYRQLRGPLDFELTVSGDEMTGLVSGRPVSLRRVDPSSPPGSPPK
jgi:hypothetical protein